MNTDDSNENAPEDLRSEIQRTRANLAHKATCLGKELQHAGDEVKETVRERIESVKDAFSFEHHIAQSPWKVMALAVLAGAAANRFLMQPLEQELESSHSPDTYRGSGTFKSSHRQHSVFRKLTDSFKPEIQELRQHLVHSATELARDVAQHTLPPSIVEYFDGARSGGRRRRKSEE